MKVQLILLRLVMLCWQMNLCQSIFWLFQFLSSICSLHLSSLRIMTAYWYSALVYVLSRIATRKLRGIGKQQAGLYYLINEAVDHLNKDLGELCDKLLVCMQPQDVSSIAQILMSYAVICTNDCNIWHLRLGHASQSKLRKIDYVPKMTFSSNICLICRPMVKFPKLPYPTNDNKCAQPFELIHIDIWGPYRVLSQGKYRYFVIHSG